MLRPGLRERPGLCILSVRMTNCGSTRCRSPRLLSGLAGAWLLLALTVGAQSYEPGQTYFGRSNYIEYIAGNLPVILSAPHGGDLKPAEIPDRTYGTLGRDTNTEDLARRVRTALQDRTGLVPHIIFCRLHREKIDCNRDIVEGAQGNVYAEIAWNDFQDFIIAARSNTVARQGRGFYIDLHGHGHDIPRLELGYLLTSSQLGLSDGTLNSIVYENASSIRALSQLSPLSFSALLRGAQSFGALMVAQGYPSVPSPDMPNPGSDPYFNGGYNTRTHGSRDGGFVDGLQIECHYAGVRDTTANRTAFAQSLAAVLEDYFARHYGMALRESYPKLWLGGGGSWGTANNWADRALPVNTNHLLFAGGGGSLNHNLAGLSVVSTLIFSNAATASYTLTGNPLTLLRGLTNQSSFAQIINVPVTVPGDQTFVTPVGTLTFGGGLTNPGGPLRIAGSVSITNVISGAGGLTKLAPGTLALTAVNTYSGPTTNLAGSISVNATATFGNGSGLLVLAGGDILSLNTRSGAPLANPLLLTGSSTLAGTGTLTNSLRVLPFSTDNISTPNGSLTVRNAGTNPYASNNVFRVRFTGGGFDFTRPLTIGVLGDLPGSLSQVESYNPGDAGDQVFSGILSGTGQFRRDAASPANAGRTILSGINTYSGGTLVNAGTLLVNNPFGSGTGSGFVTVNANGTLAGTGFIAGPVWCAGTIAPGVSVGTLTLEGGLDLSAGGANEWELGALTTDGAGVNFDQLALTDGELILGGTSRLKVTFTGNAGPPNAAEPFWLMSHRWKIVSLSGPATNPGGAQFSEIVNGSYATGSFTNFADAAGNIWLAYRAVPAPPPRIQTVSLTPAGEIVLSFNTEPNRSYVVQYATNLSQPNWVDLSTNLAPATVLTLTNAPGDDPIRLYRGRVVP